MSHDNISDIRRALYDELNHQLPGLSVIAEKCVNLQGYGRE